MNKSIPASGANAVKIILKNLEEFKYSLKNTMKGKEEMTFVFDVTYENYVGTFNFRIKGNEFVAANLNLMTLKKVITMDNDANLIKLCDYVYRSFVSK